MVQRYRPEDPASRAPEADASDEEFSLQQSAEPTPERHSLTRLDALEWSTGTRHLSIIELARRLSAASSWPQLAACVATTIAPGAATAVRLWAVLPDGPHEIVRYPSDVTMPMRSARQVRQAVTAPYTTEDGHRLVCLRAARAPLYVLELPAHAAEEELIQQVAPLLALRAASLSAAGDAGPALTDWTDYAEEVSAVVGNFAAEAKQLFDHDRLSVYLVTPDGRYVERLAVASSPVLAGESVITLFSDFGLRRVLVTNRVLVSADLSSDPRIVGREDRVIARAGYRGLLSVPLRRRGKPIGVLNFVSRKVGFYSREDGLAAEQLANYVAVFFEHLQRERAGHAWMSQVIVDRERARLARELHEVLGVTMPGMLRRARALTDELTADLPMVAARTQALAEDAERALSDSRRGLAGLVPPALDAQTIEQAIEGELALLRDTDAVETAFVRRGEGASLPLSVRRVVYGIVRECLSNIRQHAGATRVEVTFEIEDDLVLKIKDDGVGFDPAHVRDHRGLGLRFVRERAQLLGGNVRIDSAKQRGTTLTVRLLDINEMIDAGVDEPWGREPAMTGLRLRVFVVESHQLLLAGIKHALDKTGDARVIGHAQDGATALERIARMRPDVVLIDIDADPDGASASMRQIRRVSPNTTVVGMSDLEVNASAQMTEHGAAGVVAKNLTAEDLVGLLVSLSSDELVNPGIERPGSAGATPLLTPHETAILALIAAGRTNTEIGQSLFAATKTVERHVMNIVAKLGARNRTHAAAIAISTGLVRLP
ncbi:helix-turn-helix transcriptional regulator [Amycolatopsis pithecellobii]|nr:hybrid sensor histidine kinase/response regulator transcription factor [Amycolatopsis pithecellobii]